MPLIIDQSLAWASLRSPLWSSRIVPSERGPVTGRTRAAGGGFRPARGPLTRRACARGRGRARRPKKRPPTKGRPDQSSELGRQATRTAATPRGSPAPSRSPRCHRSATRRGTPRARPGCLRPDARTTTWGIGSFFARSADRSSPALPGSTQRSPHAAAGRPACLRFTRGHVLQTGTVKWFNAEKGFGFIQPESGGPDAFVHISAVERAGMDTLREGDRVRYELVRGNNGKSSAEELAPAG